MLTITSRVNKANYHKICPEEIKSLQPNKEDTNEGENMYLKNGPANKKYVIISARVHPGETVASFMMEGFLKFITSSKCKEAKDLRSKLIFIVIPISNPDGVILGNYRTSMSGNDLNRTYLEPHKRLHPTTCAIKDMIEEITTKY